MIFWARCAAPPPRLGWFFPPLGFCSPRDFFTFFSGFLPRGPFWLWVVSIPKVIYAPLRCQSLHYYFCYISESFPKPNAIHKHPPSNCHLTDRSALWRRTSSCVCVDNLDSWTGWTAWNEAAFKTPRGEGGPLPSPAQHGTLWGGAKIGPSRGISSFLGGGSQLSRQTDSRLALR